jgi:hypothetical protein
MRAIRLESYAAIAILSVSVSALSSCNGRAAETNGKANSDPDVKSKEVATASTPDEFELPPEQLKVFSAKGLNGDGEAAYSVYLHYALGWTSQSSSEEQERWLTYAVENGYEPAWLARAGYLMRDPSDSNCRRAAYWYRKLLQSRNPDLVKATREKIETRKTYWSRLSSVPICDELAKL